MIDFVLDLLIEFDLEGIALGLCLVVLPAAIVLGVGYLQGWQM